MSRFLEKILATTREDVEARKRQRTLAELKAEAAGREPRGASLVEALRSPRMSLIAEIKRASPSKGDIRRELDVAEIAAAYERGGAAAISVLTEERHFKGSLDDLRAARAACNLPVLRKDFIIDAYQIWEAAAAGANAVLLIVAALGRDELINLANESVTAGLDCLVEVHNREELETAVVSGILGRRGVLGINNRDLRTFKVDLETTLNLIKSVTKGIAVVSESGIRGRNDVVRLEAAGVRAILVGESLMRSEDPAKKLRELLS